MALPDGWGETANEWRVRLRDPNRFLRLRPKPFAGIKGVYVVGGPLKADDRDRHRHKAMAYVVQGLRFKKSDWPSLTAAVGWLEASKFGGMIENPPRRARRRAANPPKGSIPKIESAYNDGYSNGRIDKSIGQRSEYSWHVESDHTLEHSDSGVRWRTAYTMGYRDGWEGKPRRRDFGPERKTNPPRIRRGQLRLTSFRVASAAAIEKLVATEAELSSLMAQALELVDRGAPVPEWIRERARGLNLERRSQLEDVKTAVARQGAAIEEFSTPPAPGRARRENPARVKAEAIRLYESFHGHAPTGYHLERVPDLSQLVTLGRVLSIDYQLDPRNARGHRNTPYTHRFGPGSTLLTDPTGRALVVVGNVKVSRAPRGRFGYIREASGV